MATVVGGRFYRVTFSDEVYDKFTKREQDYMFFEADDELEAWRFAQEWLNEQK